MAVHLSERTRSVTFGPVVVALANHGSYETELPGDNFGLPWRAARLYFPLEGELHFKAAQGNAASSAHRSRGPHALPQQVGARGAALAAGWHPFHLASAGAQVLEVDIATERFDERDLLQSFSFAAWRPESCLPSATAAALRELIDRPGSAGSAPIRAETARVVTALLGTMLHAARLATETAPQAALTVAPAKLTAAALAKLPDAGELSEAPKLTRSDILKYLHRKYRDAELTPAAVAEHFHVSLRTLYRCFDDGGRTGNDPVGLATPLPRLLDRRGQTNDAGAAVGGMRPAEADGVSGALAQLRVEHALKLLADSRFADYTLDELAEMCGYRTALSLRRAVQAATGQTPSQLRAAN